jgi:hypothetical protein
MPITAIAQLSFCDMGVLLDLAPLPSLTRWRGWSTARPSHQQTFVIPSRSRCFGHERTRNTSDFARSSAGPACRLKLSAQLIKPT